MLAALPVDAVGRHTSEPWGHLGALGTRGASLPGGQRLDQPARCSGTVSVPLPSSSVPKTPVTGRDGGSPLSQAVRVAGIPSKLLILLIHEYVSPQSQGGLISGSPVSCGLNGFSFFYNQAISVTYHQMLVFVGKKAKP